MRIGIVTGEYPPAVGGVGDHAARLACEVAALGHRVEVLTSRITVPPAEEAEPGAPLVMRRVRRWDWRILAALPRAARLRGWDVLHIQYQPGAYGLHPAITLLPAWLRRWRGTPAVVTTFHDLRVPYVFPKAGPLRPLAVRQLARGSHGAIAVAEEDLPQLAAWTRGAATVVRHVPLGNQLDAPPPADFDRAAWRAGTGVPPGAALVGHFGFVNRSKGVDDLVRATASLARAGRDVHLLMIGDPLGASDATNRSYLAEIRRLVQRLGLEERVHWTGFQAAGALAGWLRCVDVAALPFRDGASLRRTSLIAAWAHGAPVLTTEPARPADWLGDPPAAATVPAASADRLAAALAGLLDDPQRRAALQAAGRDFARRFSWPEVARQTAGLYEVAWESRRRS